jgi:hypothetical protein
VGRRTHWFHKINDILAEVENTPVAFWDRRMVEQALNVSPTQAKRVMRKLGAWEVGKNLILPRRELLLALNKLSAGEQVDRETKRRARLEELLGEEHDKLKGRKHRIYYTEQMPATKLEGMPHGVTLMPGKLTVEFFGAEDLGRQLYELGQIMLHDWERFRNAVE